MEALKRVCCGYLLAGIMLSVALVCGMPIIVFGVIAGKWILFSIGVLLVICGMYVMPFVWIFYGKKKSSLRLVRLVVSQNIRSVKTLSTTTGQREEDVRGNIMVLITQGYLAGFVLDGEGNICAVEPEQAKPKIVMDKCPNCGAGLRIDGAVAYCQYCGSRFDLV